MSSERRPAVLARPMTAFEFLTGPIVDLVREEPRRMWMGIVAKVGTHDDLAQSDALRGMLDYADVGARVPACGAVGCVAGWTNMLTCGYESEDANNSLVIAARTLGLYDGSREVHCFAALAPLAQELFCPGWLVDDREQGTPEHAERVVAHVLSFAARNRALLEATVVRPMAGGAA